MSNPDSAAQKTSSKAIGAPLEIRQIRIDGDVAYVPLTKGYEAVIDVADVPLVEGYNWRALVKPNTVYARRDDYSGKVPRTVFMHRVLMDDPQGLEIDHKDGDGLNNRRSSNLRVATKTQNQHNQRLAKSNSSGFKGVTWDRLEGKWRAKIMLNGKRRSLGCHATPEDAHAARCKASKEMHGEFARDN